MTPKQRLKKLFPGVYAKQGSFSGNWYIYRKDGKMIGCSHGSAAAAWNEAAKRYA